MLRPFASFVVLATLCASAPFARADVVISSDATQNLSCSAGVCAPTAASAVLNVSDLEAMLASGNVEVTTTGSGVQATDIKVKAPLSWSSASVLALDSYRDITVEKSVRVTGAGGVSLTTNDGGTGGMLLFGERGHINFANLASPLTINGTTYVLVNSIASLASAANANPSGAYALAGDYDARKHKAYREPPVSALFGGSFEGLGNTISHFAMQAARNRDAGLFYYVLPGGSVAGLILSNMNLHMRGGEHHAIAGGGVAGINDGVITNCRVSGHISGSSGETGGLVGANLGTISGSSANVQIVTSTVAGGLAGYNAGTISRSYAEGSIACGGSAGNCMFAGGLVGEDDGSLSPAVIFESFSTMSVSGNGARHGAVLGGLIAEMNAGEDTNSVVRDSYATGSVSGSNNAYAGGLIGEIFFDTGRNMVQRSYSTGALTAQGGGMVGGFACQIGTGNAKLDYWDTTTSGTDDAQCGTVNANGVTGLTTTQLQAGLPTGFNPKIWKETPNINNGFPYLIANPPPQ